MKIAFSIPFFESEILDVDVKLPWYLRPFKKIIDRYAKHRFKMQEQFGYRTEEIQVSNIQDAIHDLICKMHQHDHLPEVILMGPDHHKALLFESMSFNTMVCSHESGVNHYSGLTVILVPWYDGIMVLPKVAKPHVFKE